MIRSDLERLIRTAILRQPDSQQHAPQLLIKPLTSNMCFQADNFMLLRVRVVRSFPTRKLRRTASPAPTSFARFAARLLPPQVKEPNSGARHKSFAATRLPGYSSRIPPASIRN